MDGKWQKQQDQRAIQSRDVNNGSYLVTWVTSCSSRQPLPNLWTSLVRAEPQQSPCVTLCICCEHRASFTDIFASRKVPGHWPCLPQAALPRGSIAKPTAGESGYTLFGVLSFH